MTSTHQRNVSGMHEAPRCQARTRAGEACLKPAMNGSTLCETHGGKGSRNPSEQSKSGKRGFDDLEWERMLEVRRIEKQIRRLKRLGEMDAVAQLSQLRRELLDPDCRQAPGPAPAQSPEVESRAEELDFAEAEQDEWQVDPDHPLRHLNRDRARGAMLGLAVGEAVGITLFGQPRGTFREVEHMRGGGLLGVKPGQWAGDTAAALALMDSLICRGRFVEGDFLDRLLSWRDAGTYSCTSACLGIDDATEEALRRYKISSGPAPAGTRRAAYGNASLARLAPVAIRYWQEPEERRDAAMRQSLATHASAPLGMGCTAFADMLADGIADRPKSKALSPRMIHHETLDLSLSIGDWERLKYRDVSGGDDGLLALEAAMWCVGNSIAFEDAVLLAANLGDDAGSTAALAGQLAGAFRGMGAIPSRWLDQLAWRDRIIEMTDALFDQGPPPRPPKRLI